MELPVVLKNTSIFKEWVKKRRLIPNRKKLRWAPWAVTSIHPSIHSSIYLFNKYELILSLGTDTLFATFLACDRETLRPSHCLHWTFNSMPHVKQFHRQINNIIPTSQLGTQGQTDQGACPSQQVWVELRFEQINVGLRVTEKPSMYSWLF